MVRKVNSPEITESETYIVAFPGIVSRICKLSLKLKTPSVVN